MLKFIIIGICMGMFAFSAWIYIATNDWVAIIFMIVSLTYAALFNSGRLDGLFDKDDSEN